MMCRGFCHLGSGREMDKTVCQINWGAKGFPCGTEGIPFGAAEYLEDQHGGVMHQGVQAGQWRVWRKTTCAVRPTPGRMVTSNGDTANLKVLSRNWTFGESNE
jgi:hypothetical protein